jgi:hypothetical protein
MARGNRANRSIGGAGLEQGGPNLGNDYSRDITRETTEDDTTRVVVPHNRQDKMKPGKQQPATQANQQRREEEEYEFDD